MVLDPPLPEDVPEAAAIWFARMRRPDALLFKMEFDSWLADSPDHRIAYNRIAETFSLGKNLTSDIGLNSTEPKRRTARRVELLFVSITIVLGCGFAAALWNERFGSPVAPQTKSGPVLAQRTELATQENQLKSIRLADGSWVTLDEGSRMSVSITATARAIDLKGGRARFRVAHESRPFLVSAGLGAVIARGTIFDVARQKDGSAFVALLQGSVDVITRSATRADARVLHRQRLTPGQALSVSSQAPASPAAPVADDGWANAPMDFDNARLADVVAQANFKARRPIRIESADIGNLRMSGTFRISDTRQLAVRLANLFDLNADDRGTSEIVLRRRSVP